MKYAKNLSLFLCIVALCSFFNVYAQTPQELSAKAEAILKNMSLKEKIGQKIMLDLRSWCAEAPAEGKPCAQDFTQMNPAVAELISKNHLGGIILFSNNLKNIEQITTLTYELQQLMSRSHPLGLLIAADQEGGIVGRLPREVSVSFPGNMALTAASLGKPNQVYGRKVGQFLAADLKAVGINTNFAPDVDVNSNPLNPVIHVRSFSDDPELVAELGLEVSQGIQAEGIASTLKHFPGHGDTITDSHVGLPIVEHSYEEAWAIDLYPFKKIIEKSSPDLVMTAHIQYPSLDNSLIYASLTKKELITPATLSRKIQTDLLRTQLGFQGVLITDALVMGAIAENFDPLDATIKAFQAGNDIALMPLSITKAQDQELLSAFIGKIEAAVLNGSISEAEVDASVLRILKLKIKLGLLAPDTIPLSERIAKANKQLADKSQREFESELADAAITLIQNNQLLPLTLHPNTRIHIITPWLEQGAGIAFEIQRLQNQHYLPNLLQISMVKMADTDFAAEKKAIDQADIVIVGYSTKKSSPIGDLKQALLEVNLKPSKKSLVFPELLGGDSPIQANYYQFPKLYSRNTLPEDKFAYNVLAYAKAQHKKTIFLSFLAPYDLPNYAKVSDLMLAGYDPYGYLALDSAPGYFRGPSMQALTRVLFGVKRPQGKLPIAVPNPSKPQELIYPRGFGLSMDG